MDHINNESSSYEKRKECFLKELQQFHETRGTPSRRPPKINGQVIDLYLLYTLVTNRGGWVKVNSKNEWDAVLDEFHLPKHCVNRAVAIKQIYLRYLDRYEKIHYLGEVGERSADDDEDTRHKRWSARALHSVPLVYNHSQHNVNESLRKCNGLSTDLHKPSEYEKLGLSLIAPLANEQDFAINVCTLMANNEGKHALKLGKHKKLLHYLLAHAAVFSPCRCCSLRPLFYEHYNDRGYSLSRWWEEVVDDPSLLQLIDENLFLPPKNARLHTCEIQCPGTSEKTADSKGDACEYDFFNIGRSLGVHDFIGQRVSQIAAILRNLSFTSDNLPILSNDITFLRFVLLCCGCKWGNLRQLGWEMLSNTACEITMQNPIVDKIVITAAKALFSEDRTDVLGALETLNKLGLKEENEDTLQRLLEHNVYERVCSFLSLHDILLLVYTLECLYSLSSMGTKACNAIVRVRGAIDVLVSLVTVEAQSYGPKACIQMRVTETVTGSPHPSTQAGSTPTTSTPSVSTPSGSVVVTATVASTSQPPPLVSTSQGLSQMVNAHQTSMIGSKLVVSSVQKSASFPTSTSLSPVIQTVATGKSPTVQPSSVIQPVSVIQTSVIHSSVNQSSPTIQSSHIIQSPSVIQSPQVIQTSQIIQGSPVIQTSPIVQTSPIIQGTSILQPSHIIQTSPVIQSSSMLQTQRIISTNIVSAASTPPQPPPEQIALENEQFALAWLRASFESNKNGRIEQAELYKQYITCCAKIGRHGVIAPHHFPRCVKSVFGGSVSDNTAQYYEGIQPRVRKTIVTSQGSLQHTLMPQSTPSPILKAQLSAPPKPTSPLLPAVKSSTSQLQQQLTKVVTFPLSTVKPEPIDETVITSGENVRPNLICKSNGVRPPESAPESQRISVSSSVKLSGSSVPGIDETSSTGNSVASSSGVRDSVTSGEEGENSISSLESFLFNGVPNSLDCDETSSKDSAPKPMMLADLLEKATDKNEPPVLNGSLRIGEKGLELVTEDTKDSKDLQAALNGLLLPKEERVEVSNKRPAENIVGSETLAKKLKINGDVKTEPPEEGSVSSTAANFYAAFAADALEDESVEETAPPVLVAPIATPAVATSQPTAQQPQTRQILVTSAPQLTQRVVVGGQHLVVTQPHQTALVQGQTVLVAQTAQQQGTGAKTIIILQPQGVGPQPRQKVIVQRFPTPQQPRLQTAQISNPPVKPCPSSIIVSPNTLGVGSKIPKPIVSIQSSSATTVISSTSAITSTNPPALVLCNQSTPTPVIQTAPVIQAPQAVQQPTPPPSPLKSPKHEPGCSSDPIPGSQDLQSITDKNDPLKKKKKTVLPSVSTPSQPAYVANAAFHVIKRHALELISRKEQPDDNEGPVTKSIRLTASLILRNLVIYSTNGKNRLVRYEPHLATVALSNVESSRTLAHLLYDMSQTR